jgi:hypothetical protein
MTRVVAILVGETNEALIKEPLDNASALLEKFISDPQVAIFAVDRLMQHDDGTDETSVVYTALTEMQYRKDRMSTIIFVKKGPCIVSDAPIPEQLLVTP